MRRFAEFLAIDTASDVWPGLVVAASFAGVKRHGADLLPGADFVLDGGSRRFLYKGTNERWRAAIPHEDLALYDEKVAQRFTPGLARWIEGGRRRAGDPQLVPS